MANPANLGTRAAQHVATRLRFPQLFWLTLVLFLVDLVVPDMIPFADEILLGLATALFGALRVRVEGAGQGPGAPASPRPPMKDVTPR